MMYEYKIKLRYRFKILLSFPGYDSPIIFYLSKKSEGSLYQILFNFKTIIILVDI